MPQVAIVSDSTACIPQDMVAKYGIEIVPVVFLFGDVSYRDGIDMNTTEFYKRLRRAKKLPTTSGSLPLPYLEAYRRASRLAESVLCITVSAKLSGIYNSARLAMDMAKKEIPRLPIEVLDCGTAAAAQGLVVLVAARTAAKGKNLAGVIQVATNVMQKVYLFASLDTLRYLVKGGRVPKAAALATSVLRIKPVFAVGDGSAYPLTNARTMVGALKTILKLMEEKVIKERPLHVAVIHADALDKAGELANEISRRFNCTELFITEFTPVMGVHTGPGVVGVAFYGE